MKLLFETIHSFDNEKVIYKLYRLNCTHLEIYDVIRGTSDLCSNYKTISYRKQLRKCEKMMISEAKDTSTHFHTSYH